MHTGSLLAGWLCLPGGTCALSGAHPLGNISQFHDIRFDSKALDLTQHEQGIARVNGEGAHQGHKGSHPPAPGHLSVMAKASSPGRKAASRGASRNEV